MNDNANKINDAGNYIIDNKKTTTCKSFEHKTKIIETNAEVVVPLKYLRNNFKELDLGWTRNCIISEISRIPEAAGDNPAEATLTTSATFQINNLNVVSL